MREKKEFREKVLKMRNSIPETQRYELSRSITAEILKSDSYGQASVVAAYVSFGSEFRTEFFISDVLASRRTLVLPRVSDTRDKLEFFACDNIEKQLAPGKYGILEPIPDNCEGIASDRIEFMLVPGLAFSPMGHRLGYGGGFYDRAIRDLGRGVSKVAGAFAPQVFPNIPIEPHDCSVDIVFWR